MASIILTGDRRYATVRGKFTVLGKVPKPINLPSQKLENGGLDPNVEIVPRGTLTWGSRSATSNAWASSASSSLHADENANSPVSGRPSSSGSCPRPSASGCDKSHELSSKAWGQNSWPSSASGIFASNQLSLAASRPQSAESRPACSQPSRFAENSTENTVSWGSTTNPSGYTPSSGDFPPLGSANSAESHMQRGHSSHGRPASASGSSTQNERPEPELPCGDVKAESDSRNVDIRSTDSYPYGHGDIPLDIEKWKGDPQRGWAYPIADMPHPQFGNWHGPAVNASDGVWRRETAGGPFRLAGSAVNSPIEHFAHFRQIQGLLPNPQSIPRPGGGLGCYYPENRDMHLPHQLPDSYRIPSQQIINLTPGVQQTLQSCDGCHDSQANYFDSTNSEVPCIGNPPDVRYQYDKKFNVHSRKFHMSYSSSAPIMGKEQAKSDQADEISEGQHVFLLKQEDDGGDYTVHKKREQSTLSKFPQFEGSNQHEAPSHQGNWRVSSRNGEVSSATPTPGTGWSSELVSDWEGHSSDDAHLSKSLGDLNKATDESLTKESSGTFPMLDEQQSSAIKRDSSLMEKIEVLNNKARIADRHIEGGQLSLEDIVKTPMDVNLQMKAPEKNTCIGDTLDGSCIASGIAQPASLKKGTSNGDTEERKVVLQPSESQVFRSTMSGGLEDRKKAHQQIRRKGHFMQSGLDCCVKSGFTGSQGDNALVKRTAGKNSTEISSPRDKDNYTVSDATDFSMSQDIIQKQVLHNAINAVDGSLATKSVDSENHHEIQGPTQEAIAMQHSKQLEDHQVKELNTKSLTGLEGLNRHIGHGFDQNFNSSTTTSKDFYHMQAFKSESTPKTVGSVDEAARGNCPGNDSVSTIDSSLRSQNLSLSLDQDANKSGDVTHKSIAHFHESKFLKHKNMGYRRKQSTIQEKIRGEQPFSVMTVGSSVDVRIHHLASDSVPKIEDLPTQPKKKTNRTSKSKLKADEASLKSSIQSSSNNGENLENQSESLVQSKSDLAQSVIEALKNQCGRVEVGTTSTEDLPQKTEHYSRGSNQQKSQSSRSMRKQRGIKAGDKFHGSEAVMWSPVRPQNKTIQSEGTTLNHNNQSNDYSLENDEHDTQNVVKTKRAEMERYVPKPAVKERLHQNSQQNLPSINQAPPGEVMVEPDFGGTPSVRQDFGSDASNGEGDKSNRCGKMHVSWRQRRSDGLPLMSQSFCNEGSISSDATGLVQSHQHHQSKGDSGAEAQIVYDNMRDMKLINDSGSAFSLTDINGLHCGSNVQKDEPPPALESAAFGNENARFSHEQKRWQPKCQSYPHSTGHGKRGMRSQRVISQGQRFGFGIEFHTQGTGNYPENEDVDFSAEITRGIEMRNAGNQEANAVPQNAIKKDLAEKQAELVDKLYNGELLRQDNQQEQLVSSAMRQRGTNNGHYRRGHESTYRAQNEWRDATMQNPNFSRGRSGGSVFEYQQIGSFEKPNDSSQQNLVDLEKHDGPRVHRTKNRGQGPNYYRRHGGGSRQFYVQANRTAVCVVDKKNSAE